jgi:DNA (cytosine-5)-methyltransferase 1
MGGKFQGQDATDDGGAVVYPNSFIGGQGRSLNGRSDQGSGAQVGTGFGSADSGSWIIGHDGKARRVPESSIRLLAHGVPARVGKLRALGNAIDPRPAVAFITAYMQARGLIADQQAVAA